MKTLNDEIEDTITFIDRSWTMVLPANELAGVVEEIPLPGAIQDRIDRLIDGDLEEPRCWIYSAGRLAGTVVGFVAGLRAAGLTREEIVRRVRVLLSDLAEPRHEESAAAVN